MNKTAMQMLIDWMQKYKKINGKFPDQEEIIWQAVGLRDTAEVDNITEAYENGIIESHPSGEDYYTQTYQSK